MKRGLNRIINGPVPLIIIGSTRASYQLLICNRHIVERNHFLNIILSYLVIFFFNRFFYFSLIAFSLLFFRHFILSWNFNIWKRLTVEKSEHLLYHFNYAYVCLFLLKNNVAFLFSTRIILFSSYKVYRIITTLLSSWIFVTENLHLLTWITEATRGFSSSDVSIVGAPGLLSIGSLPLALQKRVENGIPNWILAECTDRPFLWDKCNRFIYIVFIVQ